MLVKRDGYCLLTDLGIAVKFKRGEKVKKNTFIEMLSCVFTTCALTQVMNRSGTHGYMAPEVYTRNGHGIPSEWFSMGVVLHEFVVLHKPFETAEKLIEPKKLKHITGPKSTLSAGCQEIITQLLHPNPDERLSGAALIKTHTWFSCFDWNALEQQSMPAPFIPDISVANCDTGDENLMEQLNFGGGEVKKALPADLQAKFVNYKYNTDIKVQSASRRGSVSVLRAAALLVN